MYNEVQSKSARVGPCEAQEARSHVEELQRAVSAVRSLVDSIERLRDTISGGDRPPECETEKTQPIPCLLDQLMATPDDVLQACERGHKAIETMRGFLRLR